MRISRPYRFPGVHPPPHQPSPVGSASATPPKRGVIPKACIRSSEVQTANILYIINRKHGSPLICRGGPRSPGKRRVPEGHGVTIRLVIYRDRPLQMHGIRAHRDRTASDSRTGKLALGPVAIPTRRHRRSLSGSSRRSWRTFGPKKVMDRLRALEPDEVWPADSTAGKIGAKPSGAGKTPASARSPGSAGLGPLQRSGTELERRLQGRRPLANKPQKFILQCRALSHPTTDAVDALV